MKTFFSSVAVATMALMPMAAQAITIDLFTKQQFVEDAPQSGSSVPSSSQTFANSTVGDFRDLDATNSDGFPAGTQLNADGNDLRRLNLSNGAGGSGTGTITYDGFDQDPTAAGVDTFGLGGVDLTDGGQSGQFAFRVLLSDFAFDYSIEVWDIDSSSIASGVIGAATEDEQQFLRFSEFSGIDFTSIGAIQLSFTGGRNADLTIDNFRTEGPAVVPVPASVPLLLTGLGLLAFLRRRKG